MTSKAASTRERGRPAARPRVTSTSSASDLELSPQGPQGGRAGARTRSCNPLKQNCYLWVRRWVKWGVEENLTAEGFFPELEDGDWHLSQPAQTLAQLRTEPVLGLLGEVGSGKTTAIVDEVDSTREPRDPCQRVSRYIDLSTIESIERLRAQIHQLLEESATHGVRLALFLDSLDEAVTRLPLLGKGLPGLLRELSSEHGQDSLFVRVACRTSEFPRAIKDGLDSLAGGQPAPIFVLAPLALSQVSAAATVEGVEATAFVSALSRAGVQPLAIRPVTLRLLLRLQAQRDGLPQSRSELYEMGLRALVEEHDKADLRYARSGRHSADQRLCCAGFIAAAQIVCNRGVVWKGSEVDRPDPSAIVGSEVDRQKVYDEDRAVLLDLNLLDEVLASGLFVSRDDGGWVFAHRSYSEFLAARFLVRCGLKPKQLEPLFLHASGQHQRVPLQLSQTASWAAGFSLTFLERLINADPLVAIRADLVSKPLVAKRDLLRTLLREASEGTLADLDRDLYGHYVAVEYPELAEDLLPVIKNRALDVIPRRMAIDIAEACGLVPAVPHLLEVALDQAESYPVRVQAAHAIVRLGDDSSKAQLAPLAHGAAGDDPDDELKGCALRALWPTLVPTRELLPLLSIPKRRNLFGAYAHFLELTLPAQIQMEDLHLALEWVRGVDPHYPLNPLAHAGEAILTRGIAELGNPRSLEAVADHLGAQLLDPERRWRLPHWREPFRTLQDRPEDRRQLVAHVVHRIQASREAAEALASSLWGLLGKDDFEWVSTHLSNAAGAGDEECWSRLLTLLWDPNETHQTESICELRDSVPALAAETAAYFDPIDLDSDRARHLRESFLQSQRRQSEIALEQKRQARRSREWSRGALRLLQKIQDGDSSAWIQLSQILATRPDGSGPFDPFDPFGSDLSGGIAALGLGEDGERGLLTGAAAFLAESDPACNTWIGTNQITWSAIAGYRALRLLAERLQPPLSPLCCREWERWAAVVPAYPTGSGSPQAEEPHRRLASLTYRQAPREFTDCLVRLLEAQDGESSLQSVLYKVADCWDGPLGSALLELARKQALKPKPFRSLLEALLQHEVSGASELTKGLISTREGLDQEARERRVQAGVALLSHDPADGWSPFWEAAAVDEEFARGVLEGVLHGALSASEILKCLPDNSIADLFMWLEKNYPGAPWSDDGSASWVKPVDSARDAKHTALQILKERGATNQLERIAEAGLAPDWMRFVCLEAQAKALALQWTPPTLDDLASMMKSPAARHVGSSDQLLDVVLESLEKLQEELHGENLPAQFLWDRARRVSRPKDETALSDFIAWHLQRDLSGHRVVVNREVQVRRSLPQRKGEECDIHIDAFATPEAGAQPLKLVVEVKGCWNPRVLLDIRDQLLGRYLVDNPAAAGLYVVWWFGRESWDRSDSRRKRAAKWRDKNSLAIALRRETENASSRVRSLVLDGAIEPVAR